MLFRLRFVLPFLFLCSFSSRAGVLSGFESFERYLDRFEFMSEVHLSCNGGYFSFHQDSTYLSRYFIETNSDLEFALVSYRKLVYSVWSLYVRTGMGRQDELVIFDPRNSRYGIVPALELRLPWFNLNSGLEHFCFHDIDRNDDSTEYWNKPYVSLRSSNDRLGEYRRGLIDEGKWDLASRLSWSVSVGHYASTIFGIFPRAILTGGHDYDWEATFESRYAFYKRLSWLVNARILMNLNLSTEKTLYQTYGISLQSHFRRGHAGSMLYMDYYPLDQLPVRPKDRLLETGVRFYL